MTRTALVVGELSQGRLAGATHEAIGAAAIVSGSPAGVSVLLAGRSARTAAGELARSGVARVVVVEDPRFDAGPPAVLAVQAAATAARIGVGVVVVGGTTFGREIAGRVAARWDGAVATGVTEVAPEGESVRVRRPVFGGRATETRVLGGPRVVLAIRPHAFPTPASDGPTPPIEVVPAADLPAPLLGPIRTGVESAAAGAGPGLSDAAIVVSGGRGLRGPENFHLVEELAASLGAAVGASRAVTDAGWRPGSLQVGQTGKAVSPQLYIAVGISGAIQHIVGMVSSRVIVAINSDASAPIFRVADYGVVGDLFEIVPALTAEIRRVRAT